MNGPQGYRKIAEVSHSRAQQYWTVTSPILLKNYDKLMRIYYKSGFINAEED
jgi:hypothetical protein